MYANQGDSRIDSWNEVTFQTTNDMIRPSFFYDTLKANDIDFYAGVPDSLLKNLCAYITDHADDAHNIIAANEGGAMGLAAGYHLATGKIPVVYMQNSGEGNIINPLASLTDKDVYQIPVLLIIGWRGKPGVHDEPQHVKQGKVTLPLLETMGIPYQVLDKDEEQAAKQIQTAVDFMNNSREVYALVIEKDTKSSSHWRSEIASSRGSHSDCCGSFGRERRDCLYDRYDQP